jgi:HSP20 family protein
MDTDTNTNTTPRQTMPVKLYRTADRLVIAAPIAGMQPEDLSIEVTDSGRLILQTRPRGVLRAERFHVEVTVDRDGDQQVWTQELWQETKEVVLDEWSTRGYYRELELPVAVDAALGTVTYGNGVLVVALPVAETLRPAHLRLERVSEGRGQRSGSVGHPG